MRVSEILVKWRGLLMALTVATAVVFGLFIPRLNIIYEISYFLPDTSPVKIGLDKVEAAFPGLELQNNMLYVMFQNLDDASDTQKELSSFTSGMALMGERESGEYTLFQYMPVTGADVRAAKALIEEHWGDAVTVELDLDKNMPADIVPMIVLGAILVLIVLLVMCQSFMEVFLFLTSMLIAVVLNMGSCILMNGVSYMTVTISGVLQMILSMDYSIILTNRYRQEKLRAADNNQAMAFAINGSARAILSSALTTVVSLMMLLFMKVKIGPDLGMVLSKGVICSLICNFTVLPAFILAFDKAITATSKKIPNLPFGSLARLQIKLKVPLTLLFVAIFAVAFIFQNRTEVAFSAIWETPISKIFPPQNPVILLYDNSDELAVPGVMDILDRDPQVRSTLSYPGLMLSGYTAAEMASRYGSLSPLVNEDILRIIYYAHAHPKRTESLSFAEIETTIDRLSRNGLLPDGYDMDAMLKDIMTPAPAPAKTHKAAKASKTTADASLLPPPLKQTPIVEDTLWTVVTDTSSLRIPADTLAMPADSMLVAMADSLAAPADTTAAAQQQAPSEASGQEGYPEVTYELATRQMTAKEMAALIGMDRSLVSTGYRMAGRTRKPATMSPHEMSTFIVTKILTDKRYSSFIPADQIAEIREIHRLLDSAFIAGPSAVAMEAEPVFVSPDSTIVRHAADSAMVARAITPEPVQEPEIEEEEEEAPPTPMERLAMMYMSGRRYPAATVYSALKDAGVQVSRDDIDLLYLYAGCTFNYDKNLRMSPGGMVNFLYDSILPNPMYARFIDEEARESLDSMRDLLSEGIEALHSDSISVALALTDYNYESPETFEFLERFQTLADRSLKEKGVLLGESVIYKEFKEDFPSELLLLTLLTVGAIFIIVLLTFNSVVIPVLLILTVMSGVYVNVIVSGFGGQTMFFLAYLIVQSVLMGATIDYSILFTSMYREERMTKGIASSLETAFRRAGHSIFTSGLILTLAPYAMSFMISDHLVSSILKSLAGGALAALLIIIFIQPGVIAVFDRFVAPKGAVKRKD